MEVGLAEKIYLNIIFIVIWSLVGFVVTKMSSNGPLKDTIAEYVNPFWIYENYHVNYFGTIVLFLIYNLISPITSICYWIHKLCTVGRK